MNKSNDIIFSFSTFYISNEESHFPLIPEIIKYGKNLKSHIKDDQNLFSTISIVYGKRVLTNAKNSVFNNLNIDDFIEIVDFNPVGNILILMGKKNPSEFTPIQWFIHHAKKEILITLIINNDDIEKFKINIDAIPIIEKQSNLLDMIKNIMKQLQTSNCIYIKKIGLLITGNTLNEIKNNIEKISKRVR